MEEFVFKPPKSCGIKDLANAADHAPDTERYGRYPNDKTAKYGTEGAKNTIFTPLGRGARPEIPVPAASLATVPAGAGEIGSIPDTRPGTPWGPAIQDICVGACAGLFQAQE